MTLRLTAEAVEDVRAAQRWYRRQAPGLDREFRRALDACLAAVLLWPAGFPIVRKQVRRALLRRFPYAVFFVCSEAEVVVLAIYHTARDPGPIRSRFG